MTTDLIAGKNLTLGDIEVQTVTPAMISEAKTWALGRARYRRCTYGVIDPKAEHKRLSREPDFCTMIPDDEVSDLGNRANEVYANFYNSSDEEVKTSHPIGDNLFRRLTKQVVHDH